MKGGKQAREWISALMDGELAHLSPVQIDALCRFEEQKNTWTIYHQIGDILRFEHQALSHRFQINLANQLGQQSDLELPQQKNVELTALASKKIILLVAMLVMIVVVPSSVLIVKSSLSLQDKKTLVTEPINTPSIKENHLHIPVHLAQ